MSEAFGRWARGTAEVWQAPGRVNVIGEHTDYNGGLVLPIAIDRQTTVAAGPSVDGALHARSLDLADESGWVKYVEAVVRALGAMGVGFGGAEVLVSSTVPIGAGLSSSAALEVAAAAALSTLAGAQLDPHDLATVAHRAETEFVGVPVGLMDQTVAALARERHALFLDARSLDAEHIPFDPSAAALNIVVIDSGVRRRLDDGRYAERRSQCEAAAAALGVAQLRDASLDQVEAAQMDETLRRRARHVVTENERVLDVVDLLRMGKIDYLGPTLLASHASLRDDFDVSCDELDIIVEGAMDKGALGARMTGAGFGGCAIALVPDSHLFGLVDAFGDAAFEVRPVGGVRRSPSMG
ncbi:MAG: galactokinase [Acidimicrobiia bacterium]|nr:galactokinase [Acidimicrobiia bacterium]